MTDPFYLLPQQTSGPEPVACYGRGTLIDTPQGERLVEDLRIGEVVLSVEGDVLPITWIGRRYYRGWQLLDNREVAPICLRANAIADHVPKRDLWVSPCHAMFIEGVLIPAGLLVNGSSIMCPEGIWEIHYFHIELERHAVILAENAPAETFVDAGSRAMFDNETEFHATYPGAAVFSGPQYCARRVVEGLHLEAIREQLRHRALLLRFNQASHAAWDADPHGNPAQSARVTDG